jgi:uncharacterized protein (DUF2126 family)
MSTTDDFEREVREHDALVAACGIDLWVGSEPTFTDRFANTPEWMHAALGGGKLARAQAMLAALHAPGALVLRTEGRRYAGEETARWSLGLLQRRDGTPLWQGPCDPLVDPSETEADRASLPDFAGDTTSFVAELAAIERAALAAGHQRMVFTGCTPPVDASLALTTITPDPAVIEVNAAPSCCALQFLGRSRAAYAAAAAVGLSPYRLLYNGNVADSGGGGQITLGGPTPAQSPFLRDPGLLPGLVRFLNHHPSLSYLYCHDFVGAGGQSVRADERGRGNFDELRLALALLERQPAAGAEDIWRALAPFLADAAGNGHRAEINVEKLCNRLAGARGTLGLVEFRALRMQHTPERATAIACLLRAIVAMLVRQPFREPLIDWGRRLHDRYALPLLLQRDLASVLASLGAAGLGLGPAIAALLQADEFRHQGSARLPGATLEVWRALEFWPLLGDAASPEQGGTSRLIDASTARVELRLRADDALATPWQVDAGGTPVPLVTVHDEQGPVQVAAVRYRAFAPSVGLHPILPAQTPIELRLYRAGESAEWALALHEWRPDGGAYPELPVDLVDAARRRAERVVLTAWPADRPPPAAAAPSGLTPHTLDLRWPR